MELELDVCKLTAVIDRHSWHKKIDMWGGDEYTFSVWRALMVKEESLLEVDGKGLKAEPEMPLGGAMSLLVGQINPLFNWLAIGDVVDAIWSGLIWSNQPQLVLLYKEGIQRSDRWREML